MKMIDEIIGLIKPILEKEEIYLVDIELRGRGKNQVLSIYADTKEGITLSQITRLNYEISDLLDMHNIIPGSYRLEVSSPGLDRPLRYLWQYKKNINRFVQVNYLDNGDRKEIIGKLKEANDSKIIIELNKEQVKIPFSAITKTKVKVRV